MTDRPEHDQQDHGQASGIERLRAAIDKDRARAERWNAVVAEAIRRNRDPEGKR